VSLLIVVLAFAALALVVGTEVVRSRRPRSNRDAQAELPTRFETAVRFKRGAAPSWHLGAVGFTLIVRPGAFSVVGPGEGVSSYFTASDATITYYQSGNWIAIEGTESGKRVGLQVTPVDKSRIWEAWSALVTEGAVAQSDPPF
jgi:hypothetical protein